MPDNYEAIIIGGGHNGLAVRHHYAGSGQQYRKRGHAQPFPGPGPATLTPVDNVYLCGSGSHPGGGVSMAPGRNAAQVILG